MAMLYKHLSHGAKTKRGLVPGYHRALAWINEHTIPRQGIVVTSSQESAYPEVTGYLIPTLIDSGELDTARKYAEYLTRVQHANGAFSGFDGKEYFFDSGQALRGLVRSAQQWNGFERAAARTAGYLMSCIGKDGRVRSYYGGSIPEPINVYALPPLIEAGSLLETKAYVDAAERAAAYYKFTPEVLRTDILTHFLGYVLDGFIELGERDFVLPVVKKILRTQKRNGGIPGLPWAKWVCSTGVAQFAVIAYKLGLDSQGNEALRYLLKVQNDSGGFYGSYGFKPAYFPDEEISWACKFFLDAIHMKVQSSFDHKAYCFPEDIALEDGRLQAVLANLGGSQNLRILDAGCGKGRFASKMKLLNPSYEIHAVDISEELLKSVPDSIRKKRGNILNLPYEEEVFDGVFCVEALEHTIRTERAVEELCRVLKVDGRIVIVDKNITKLGRMKLPDFEQWFDRDEIRHLLARYCRDVCAKEISYDNHCADGLFLSWSGTKTSVSSNQSLAPGRIGRRLDRKCPTR
jgi:malonyl-CoA O-methyltransferase